MFFVAVTSRSFAKETESISSSRLPFILLKSFSPFYSASPSSILSGFKRGFGNFFIGLSLSAGLSIVFLDIFF